MAIDTASRVGRLAAEHPGTTRVFHRFGIDYCCGGGRTLSDACAARGIDPAGVLDEIRAELGRSQTDERRWDDAPLDALIDHILVTYHASLREELPRLDAMARKVLEVHRDKAPEILPELVEVFGGLKAELDDHMQKEEQILFPMINQGRGAMASGPVSVMEHEHDSAASALRRLRELTGDYEVPDEACTTWRALWHGLAELETSLHEHIHLENNVLFPRALDG